MKKELKAFDIDGTLIIAPTVAEALETYKKRYNSFIMRAEMVGSYVQSISHKCLNDSGRDGVICCTLFSINDSIKLICGKDMLDAVNTYVNNIDLEEISSVSAVKSYTGSELAFISKDCFTEE